MEVALIVILGEERGLAIDSALNDTERMIRERDASAASHVRRFDSQMSLTPLGPLSRM